MMRHKRLGGGDLFRDERGFTTTSMVLSLLITLSLLFTAAQVYRINSASAEVQDVADAAALAAENQVAEFMIVARFCDATVLSLSLAGISACGLGIAALCTPMTAELSAGLIEAGERLIQERNDFAERARTVLGKMQEALPYLSAACAMAVAAANDVDSTGARYVGLALLVPSRGEAVQADTGDQAEQLASDIEGEADDIRELARQAEEAAQEANQAKLRAFMHDCGNNPDYCLYERASQLADVPGWANPLYTSVDAWSFSVALDRAKQYYAVRRYNDQPDGDSVDALARWQMRLRFYNYAFHAVSSQGYVRDTGDSFEANFPLLPRNTEEMKQTSLYTEAVYPVTESDQGPIMHAWSGCPGATGSVIAYESIAYRENADLSRCAYCDFSASSMGQVAAASTSIENGFEYHYLVVSQEAARYQEARKLADGPKAEVKQRAGGLFEEMLRALKEAVGQRLEVSPPGRYGALAMVVNTGTTSAAGGFASGFVNAEASLGPRAAISASTLIDEGSDEGRTVINSLLDGLRGGGGGVGAAGVVLDLWSHMLEAYSNGVSALADGVRSGLDALPLVGASGLGTWASDRLSGLIQEVGLEPAKIQALKPVLVNSAHVAAKDDGSLGSTLIATKQRIVSHPLYSTDLFSAVLSDAERAALAQVDGLGDTIQIASIELLGDGGPSIPLTIPLPAAAKQLGVGAIQGAFDRLRGWYAEAVEVRAWE